MSRGQGAPGPGRAAPFQAVTVVPVSPATTATTASSAPITTGRPVAVTNRRQASTFGPIDPAARPMASTSFARSTGRSDTPGVPNPSSTPATSVSSTSRSAPRPIASRAAVRSLSTTASAPRGSPFAPSSTGTPPPPPQTTTVPASTSPAMLACSSTLSGSGEATTRRHRSPSRPIVHPWRWPTRTASACDSAAPTGLVGAPNAGSVPDTTVWVSTASTGRCTPASRRACRNQYPIIPWICATRTSNG